MNFTSILIAILAFGFLIISHEFGHFITARIFGVKVNEFAIGMGPKLFSKKGKSTTFSIRAFPIGGFCAMQGESELENPGFNENEAEVINPDESLVNKKPWQRFIILATGATVNLFLGFIFSILVFAVSSGSIIFPVIEKSTEVLKPGDEIISINDWRIHSSLDVSAALSFVSEDTMNFKIIRNGEKQNITVPATEIFELQEHNKTPGNVMKAATNIYFSFIQNTTKSLKYLIIGKVKTTELSGPVGVVNVMSDAAATAISKTDFKALFLIISLISVNLGFMNLLPIPVLDGGHILFLIIEKIRKKPLSTKIQNRITGGFVAALLGFMAYITIQDIIRIFN